MMIKLLYQTVLVKFPLMYPEFHLFLNKNLFKISLFELKTIKLSFFTSLTLNNG